MEKAMILKEFEKHVAKLTEYPGMKILDFKRPDSFNWAIRFIFDEENYTLTISGDLGYLVAVNCNNMNYEDFYQFVHSPSYFAEKIRCNSRLIKEFNNEKAEEELRKRFEEYKLMDEIRAKYSWDDSDEEAIADALEDILCDYSENGIGSKGMEELCEIYADAWEWTDIGMEDSGILDVYFTAYDLARKQLEGGNENGSDDDF